MRYFDSFPKIEYKLNKNDTPTLVTDITKRVGIRKDYKEYISTYYKHVLATSDKAEVLSDIVYNDSYYHWVLFHANDVIDPYHDWIKEANALEEYVLIRYPNRSMTVDIITSGVSIGSMENAYPLPGEKLWGKISVESANNFNVGDTIRGGIQTGWVSYGTVAEVLYVDTASNYLFVNNYVQREYYVKDEYIHNDSRNATKILADQQSAEVISVNPELNQITYKLISGSDISTYSDIGDALVTNRSLFKVTVDTEERTAPKYYEILRTNSNGTIDRLITNKTLTADEISNLPSDYSTVPVAVSYWEDEIRENEKLREVNIIQEEMLGDFETDFHTKLGS